MSCHAADPQLYDEETDRLFNGIVDDRELAVATRQWIDAANDRNGKPPKGLEFGFWLSETLDGTWRLAGTLVPGDGKLLDEAIQHHLRPMLAARHDATFVRMVLDADGEPLDVGRATRNWPDPIANAISTRDRHCRFPGCDIAANRCDIHHRTEWQHGGQTSTDNGLLQCRRHHRFIHTNRWTVDRDERRQPVFRPPDGTAYTPPPSRRPAIARAG